MRLSELLRSPARCPQRVCMQAWCLPLPAPMVAHLLKPPACLPACLPPCLSVSAGKTMLAKAVAHHTTASFIRVVGSEFVQKYLGEVSRAVGEGWREEAGQ